MIFRGAFSLCYSPEGRAKLRWTEKSFDVGGPSSIDFIYFWGPNKKQQCDGRGGGGRSAPFPVALSSKRRVREAHGRARAAKTH